MRPNHEEQPQIHPDAVVQTEDQRREEAHAVGALKRIMGVMIASTVLLPILAYFRFGRSAATSLLLGCLVALFNFVALRKIVTGIAESFVPARKARRLVVLRFLLRYALVGVAFYAIFKGSAVNLYGLIVGLSLPVLAVFVEAGFELAHAFRSR